MKLLVLFLTAAAPLSALGANIDIDIQPIPDLPLKNIPSAPSTETAPPAGVWRFALGGGASYAPPYEGAAGNRLRFMPLLEASYNNGKLFISPLRGIGYNFSDEKEVQYGVRLMPGHSRKQSADPHLNGMGDIGYIPEAGLFFNQRFAPWYVSSGITTGSHGTHAELGGGIGFPLSAADRLRLGINLNWGDTSYNQTYFDVTASQAAASGNVLTAYNASAGIKDYALTANWVHNYDKEWFSNAGLSYKWLTGSAQQSPLTQRSSMGSLNFLMGYRF
jgi:outer membrane protein